MQTLVVDCFEGSLDAIWRDDLGLRGGRPDLMKNVVFGGPGGTFRVQRTVWQEAVRVLRQFNQLHRRG